MNTPNEAAPALLPRPSSTGRYTIRAHWRNRGPHGVVAILGATDDGPGGPRRVAVLRSLVPMLEALTRDTGDRYGSTERQVAVHAVHPELDLALLRIGLACQVPTALADLEPLTRLEATVRKSPPASFATLTSWQRNRALYALATVEHLATLALAPRGDLSAAVHFGRALSKCHNLEDGYLDERVASTLRGAVDPMLERFEPEDYDPNPGE